MERNTKIQLINAAQFILYLLFLLGILFQLSSKFKSYEKVPAYYDFIMILIAISGCSLTLVIKDYLKRIIQNESIDVVGIHNKKSLEKKLQQLEEQNDTLDIGIMMFDLNNLKSINDNYGHDEGDLFIKVFASFLTRILTTESFLARFGGDEFIIVQEHTTLKQLEEMNVQLQKLIDGHNEKAVHPISYAVGYDVSFKNHYYLIADLIKIADEKMYQDKKYKKQNQMKYNTSQVNLVPSISSDALTEKIYTILTNFSETSSYAFFMTDVDNFHLINDYWGYDMGNQLLNYMEKKMNLFPETVFSYRFHSDVFVSMVDVTGMNKKWLQDKLKRYQQDTIEEILETYPVNYFQLNTGIYWIENETIDPKEIISNTNIARRKAKEEGTGVYLYSKNVANSELHRADTLHSFKKALGQNEFQIYFQPQMGNKGKKIVSAEVLVRWERDTGELWYPDSFIPILEETGGIEELDFYVYEKTFQWIVEQKKKKKEILPLSLNVSPIHFRNIQNFTEKIMQLIKKYQIKCSDLTFEITENAYIHNIDAVNRMIEILHKKNIRISMDDFGSGYSSLNALKDILFDEVKIDKQFLSDNLSENGKIVLQEIFHLLKRTKKKIVCEGVETKVVADFLIEEECNEMQGFYYYKPMCNMDFERLINSGKR